MDERYVMPGEDQQLDAALARYRNLAGRTPQNAEDVREHIEVVAGVLAELDRLALTH